MWEHPSDLRRGGGAEPRLAAFLGERGLGVTRERADLERWELGQDPVALVLHNCAEYLEAMLGCFRARAVPFNVNQHYREREITALLADVGVRAVIYHRAYAPLVAAGCDLSSVTLIDLDDGSGVDPLPGSIPYEDAVSTPVGGAAADAVARTTSTWCAPAARPGAPRRCCGARPTCTSPAMAGTEGATAEAIAAGAKGWNAGPWYPTPPLMHAAAQWTAFCGLHIGATVLLHDDSKPFDAGDRCSRSRSASGSSSWRSWATPTRARSSTSSAGIPTTCRACSRSAPVARRPGSSTRRRSSSCCPTSRSATATARRRPAGWPSAPDPARSATTSFVPAGGGVVASADRTRFLEPGDDEVGWVARRGRVPLGYLGDREKTEATFPIVDGDRVAIPGDRGRLLADGSIELLGRDSMVINTGGEKVYVEEVEAVLRTHPDVADALVVGRPSERFGQEVVAVVSPRGGAAVEPAALREFVAAELARFKAPRAVAVCERVQRLASGKADYVWAKEAARAARRTASAIRSDVPVRALSHPLRRVGGMTLVAGIRACAGGGVARG